MNTKRSNSIIAIRDSEVTSYTSKSEGVYPMVPVIIPNNNTTLFEVLKEAEKQIQQEKKTK